MGNCQFCKVELSSRDPLTQDCGGDCLRCMAVIVGDYDTMPEVYFRLGFRAGVLAEGGGGYAFWSESMRSEEDMAWAELNDR